LTVSLAAHAGEVVGMDPNPTMLDHARRRAADRGATNAEFVEGSDADLHAGMGPFRLTTMGRSFHWMDEERTLERLSAVTEPGGGVALLTDREWLTKGRAPWQAAAYEVADAYVAGLPERVDPATVEYDDPWDEKLAALGFDDVETVTFDVDREWSVDAAVGYVLSLSFCSPATLGDDRAAFERALRLRLGEFERDVLRQTATVDVVSGRASAAGGD
jgi:SAM-dependent methyltransferase